MGSASGKDDFPDWLSADKAWLAATHVDVVFELEETFDAIGIDVIGDR